MHLRELTLTNNACYKAGKTITPKGIMVHSTGANNPNLKRYVGPDDGLLGVNTNNNHWNQDKPDGQSVCVHAFIGKLADGSIATYQTLPWNRRGWHAGSGKLGTANDTHIGFEVCEDALTDKTYFQSVFREAVGLCAYLCKLYNLDPMKDGVIISHKEGALKDIADNHGDIDHWLDKQGTSMNNFRKSVKTTMELGGDDVTQAQFDAMMNVNLEARKALTTVNTWGQEPLKHYSDRNSVNGSGKVTDGSQPQGFLTREMFFTVLRRLGV